MVEELIGSNGDVLSTFLTDCPVCVNVPDNPKEMGLTEDGPLHMACNYGRSHKLGVTLGSRSYTNLSELRGSTF